MRKTNLVFLACVLAASSTPLLAKPPASSGACWQPAFQKQDVDAVMQCYAPDAVAWLPGMPAMKGRDAIRAGYVGLFGAFTVKSVQLTELGKSRHGDDAASWGTFEMVLVSRKDGKQTTERGRYTDVSRRSGGRWQYRVDHASDDPAARGG